MVDPPPGGAEGTRGDRRETGMRTGWRALALMGVFVAGPAMAQGAPVPAPGSGGAAQALLGAFGPMAPEQRRAFCMRVGQATMRCGLTSDMTALAACLIRTLPPEDSMRATRVINVSRGSPGALLGECGVTPGR